MTCAVGKVCTHSKMTVCNTSNLDEKCALLKKKENTSVAVLNSLNSIQCQLNPRIRSNTTMETRDKEPEGPEQTTKHREREQSKFLRSSIRPLFFPPFIESEMVVLNVFSLGRGRFSQSRLDFGVCFPYKYLLTQPITLFLSVHPSSCT